MMLLYFTLEIPMLNAAKLKDLSNIITFRLASFVFITSFTFSQKNTFDKEIIGDKDPIDICVLTEKEITHGDILVRAIPIGGFRMLDGDEADDKIIAVLAGDVVYGGFKDISDAPDLTIERLKHYFLTYKDLPGKAGKAEVEITDTYGAEEAREIIKCSMEDYKNRFKNLETLLSDY